MTEKTDPSFAYLKQLHFQGAEKQIADGEYIPPEELAHLIRTRGAVEIPGALLDHVCAHLSGDVPKPRGRPKQPEIETRKLNMLIGAEYRRLLLILQDGELPAGDVEIYGSEDAAYPSMTPAERAARLVAGVFYHGAESWRSVQNIVSSQK